MCLSRIFMFLVSLVCLHYWIPFYILAERIVQLGIQ